MPLPATCPVATLPQLGAERWAYALPALGCAGALLPETRGELWSEWQRSDGSRARLWREAYDLRAAAGPTAGVPLSGGSRECARERHMRKAPAPRGAGARPPPQ
ncbi:hypothetical protein GCM10020367_28510 [Streptomyces sannanensis]|uniref:Uncharacterized protein n=1 Tax=Streptomyces sannanensis TaxID=285536 RepID=A0ABP6SB84_9ACTN